VGSVSLAEALSVYLKLKGANRPKTFHRSAERSCDYLIQVCGDRNISEYTRQDANAFRDALIERGLVGSSVTRVMGTVRTIIAFAASEGGIEMNNPFSRVYFDRQAGVKDRRPITVENIRAIQAECRQIDDDLRWLVALVSDTGMRLAEVAGLLKEDIKLNDPVPHVVIREHPWRRLKTAGSVRQVPPVGAALWAARRIHENGIENLFAFPRYNKGDQTNAKSASTALNKWLKPNVHLKGSMYSFRHSMRDRLRSVECPSDIVDQIGGWQTERVGHRYGKGYPLSVLANWMSRIE
jgi:integrase